MTKKNNFYAFTFLEILLALTIMAILGAATLAAYNPAARIYSSQKSRAVQELKEIAKAIQAYNLDNGDWPPDGARGEDPGLSDYLGDDFDWSTGPIPGTVWDYDNWTGNTCINSDADDSVQISLRNVPNRNPDGSDTWAWYIPVNPDAPYGAPHCSLVDEYDAGECVTGACGGSFDIDADV